MAKENASNVNDFPLEKAVKMVIAGLSKTKQISEKRPKGTAFGPISAEPRRYCQAG